MRIGGGREAGKKAMDAIKRRTHTMEMGGKDHTFNASARCREKMDAHRGL